MSEATQGALSVALAELDPALATEEFLARIPLDFARSHLLLSQGRDGDAERLAVGARTPVSVIFNTGVRLRRATRCVLADDEALARAIDLAYERHVPARPAMAVSPAEEISLEEALALADRDLLATQGKAPIVKLVDRLLFEALSRGASDLHIQPLADCTLVRYRIDGALHDAAKLPAKAAAAVISRIKVLARMDIAERLMPQDGRATVTIGERSIDLRIATFPTSYGERTVARLLDPSRTRTDFQSLHMPASIAQRFLAACARPDGLVLVTGPTGCGKTTTLYSTLAEIASPDLNVMTLEDPIEYELSAAGLAVSQSQVSTKKGITFPSGLRHLLRQDPDVVLVGEIRDRETAQMAIQSALTGHLVLSTLHTHDAPSAVARLVDLGVEPFLLAASLSVVMAQRLVRKLHAECGARGCDRCMQSRYLGRRAIFELVAVDEAMRGLIARNAPLAEIREAARAGGFVTLYEEGERLVREGVTDRVEVRRVVEESP